MPYVFSVTARCDLNCLGCSLDIGTSAPDEGQEFVALIRDGRFFERYPYRRAYHIVGGDPFALKYLEPLLMFLHQSKVRVTLWIHGARPGVEWERIATYVRQVFVYFPGAESEAYRIRTGYDRFADMMDTVRQLKANRIPVMLHTPVRPETISVLPDFCEAARSISAVLMVHYSKAEMSKAYWRDYVKRFLDVKGVWVLRKFWTVEGVCPEVPVAPGMTLWDWGRFEGQIWLNRATSLIRI